MERLKKNQRFGKLTIIEPYVRCDGKHCFSLVQCDCGSEPKEMRNDYIRHKDNPTCGCGSKQALQNHADSLKKNEKGAIFGKLTVIEPYYKSINGETYHLCQCECGNIVEVRVHNLRQNNTTSCGCLLSKGEEKINKILSSLKMDFKCQYSFNNLLGDYRPLRFDFALFENDKIICLIEYNGKQHYICSDEFGGLKRFNKQQEYDNKKIEYCKNNNIPLIIIPYIDYDKIDTQYLLNKISEVKNNAKYRQALEL